MSKNSSTIYAIAGFKCPRCHQGDLFTSPNPYKLKYLSVMPKQCSCCGQLTAPEPGFYYGAMYVSYVLNLILFFINFFIFGLSLSFSVPAFTLVYSTQVILLMPLTLRYSRVLYLYMFVSYDPESVS